MSILEDNQQINPLTLEQKQLRAKNQISRQASSLFQNMLQTYNQISGMVWQNRQGLTPQQVLDGLGPNAAELFALSALLVSTVNNAKPGTLSGETPYPVIINPDGTVTVIEETPSESISE
jgi:hypothetical protein